MNIREDPNLKQLIDAAGKLKPLLDELVFVGGCASGLLLSDAAAAPVRATIDVDAVVEAASYVEFMAIEQRLQELGFRQPADGGPICRWVHGDLILDLMPTDAAVLGFSNRWYLPAIKSAQKCPSEIIRSRSSQRLTFLPRSYKRFMAAGKATIG